MNYIIDTNALIYAAKKKQDLAHRIDGQILVPNLVVDELKKLSRNAKKKSDRDAAKLALQIIRHNKWKIIKLERGHADKRIRDYAGKFGCRVYTFDKKLTKSLS